MTCQSLTKNQQIASNLTYECVGNCSSSGFTRNQNGACQGKIKTKHIMLKFTSHKCVNRFQTSM